MPRTSRISPAKMIFMEFLKFWLYFWIIWTLVNLNSTLRECFSALSSFLMLLPLAGFARSLQKELFKSEISSNGKAVLITGCGSGFGLKLAKKLHSKGFCVFASCRSLNGPGPESLKLLRSSRMHVFGLDVTKGEDVQQALNYIQKNINGLGLWAIVNNAGIMERGELEWTPLDYYKKLFEVNTLGVIRVTQAFLPLLRESKGRVITTASAVGRFTLPGLGPYCMSKHATVSFCDGLRMEMKKFDVSVVTIAPYAYQSSMTEMTAVLKSAEDIWSKAKSDIKAEYGGSGYIKVFKKSLKKFIALSANPNIHEVVDTMVEAITSTSPHYSYTVGDFKSLFAFGLIRKLPLFLQNHLIRKYIVFDMDLAQFIEDGSKITERKRST